MKKEFSCKTWNPTHNESERIRYGTQNKEGAKNLICKGIPCIDGNCVDKSYEMDADMVQSVSHLGASSKGKRNGTNTKIFEGTCKKCTKKPVGYSNCCNLTPKGWGIALGSECTEEERELLQYRQDNLCVYVGKTRKRALAVTHLIKHHYCCFSNILEKTIQVEARKQLGLNFGTGYSPNCRGLTIQEIARVDFSRMDFSEIGAEMYKKIVIPNVGDIQSRIKSTFKQTTKFDHKKPAHENNQKAGVNIKSFGGAN
jgi:conjugal transfer mating pair stabilization protein TraN